MVSFVPPPPWTVALFLAIVFFVQLSLLYSTLSSAASRTRARRCGAATAVFFLAIIGLTSAMASSGFLAADPRRAVTYAVVTLAVALALGLSPAGGAMASGVPPVFWVLFEGFRLPLEIVLAAWGRAGTIPVQMTWEGQNFDVAAGAAALVLGVALMARPRERWLGLIAHLVGLFLLANVVRLAVLSLPTAGKAFAGPPLLLPFEIPFTWIVPFGIGAALFGHVVGLRALRQRRAPRVRDAR